MTTRNNLHDRADRHSPRVNGCIPAMCQRISCRALSLRCSIDGFQGEAGQGLLLRSSSGSFQ